MHLKSWDKIALGTERSGEVTAGTQLFRSVGGTVGTAVLAGIMNGRLTKRAADAANEPFVQQMQRLNLTHNNGGHFDASMIQAVLNRDNQAHIRSMLNSVPAPMRPQVNQNFDHFIGTAKVAFSHAVDGVFLVAACLMTAALIVVFFLSEIPLKKSERPVLQETGVILEDELGQSDSDAQPRMNGVVTNAVH